MSIRTIMCAVIVSASAFGSPAFATDTEFTYQGDLMVSSSPANGTYNLRFSLWNAPNGGVQVGSTILISNALVNDGKFTVNLDFGADVIGNGDRWLEVRVNSTTLAPRQPMTSAPRSIQTRGLHVDANENVGIGTSTPEALLDVAGPVLSKGPFGGAFSTRNPNNQSASFTLGWLNDVARLRIGGNGAGASGGLDIQRVGDASLMRILHNGNVGIGTTAPNAKLNIVSDGATTALKITNGGSSNTGLIIGDVVGASRAASLYGITTEDLFRSINDGDGEAGLFVSRDGNTIAVTNAGTGNGVDVTESGGGIAVRAINNGTSGSSYGVFAYSASSSGVGAYGQGKLGVYGFSGTGGFGSNGVYGVSSSADGVGVHGRTTSGGNSSSGVWGEGSGGGWAGFFSGSVFVEGSLLVSGSKNFMIDNPLNPSEEYLVHACIESDAMRNLYDGTVVLNDNGEAVVALPEWFEALNGDFRYQLTCIGGHAPVYVSSEVSHNQFTIAGGTPGLKVSWQVTGVRIDPAARAKSFQVITPKAEADRGTYLYPEGYGQPASARASIVALSDETEQPKE